MPLRLLTFSLTTEVRSSIMFDLRTLTLARSVLTICISIS